MAEQKKILTTTILTTAASDVEIFTFYDPFKGELPYTLFGRISNNVGSSNGISYIQNELIIGMINHPQHIDYFINNNGELVVFTPHVEDADRYTIDNDGYLIYTVP